MSVLGCVSLDRWDKSESELGLGSRFKAAAYDKASNKENQNMMRITEHKHRRTHTNRQITQTIRQTNSKVRRNIAEFGGRVPPALQLVLDNACIPEKPEESERHSTVDGGEDEEHVRIT